MSSAPEPLRAARGRRARWRAAGPPGYHGSGQVMHLPYLEEIPEFRLAALCDVSANQVAAVGARHHLPADRLYTDYRALADCSDVDASPAYGIMTSLTWRGGRAVEGGRLENG